MSGQHVVVIGGGIVGLATGWRLLCAHPRVRVTVLEKEDAVARHQSGNNSGVIHAGLQYRPGTVKARMAVAGTREMVAFCREHGVAHDTCGKLVVAVSPEELPRLRALHERGTANGLQGLRWLEPAAMREIEPHAAGVAGLHVPEEGIADYPGVCRVLEAEIQNRGGHVRTGAGVTRIRRNGAWTLETTAGDVHADLLVNCAGLHSDRIARLAGEDVALRIVPFRGDYFLLRPERQHLVRHLIYPVPDPAFPFLGVHFTRRITGGVEAGPSAVLAFAREGYRKRDVNARDLAEALAFPGLWRFLRTHPSTAWAELRRSFSRNLFTRTLQRLVPEIQPGDLAPGGAGVRAMAMLPDGSLVEDFSFVERPGALHVLNAPSPAATASLTIGSAIVRMLEPQLRSS